MALSFLALRFLSVITQLSDDTTQKHTTRHWLLIKSKIILQIWHAVPSLIALRVLSVITLSSGMISHLIYSSSFLEEKFHYIR